MQFQIKTFKFGFPAMLMTAVVVLPLVFVFFVFFVLWSLLARVILGRSFSKAFKVNTIFTRTMGQQWSQNSVSPEMSRDDTISDKPIIEVEGRVLRDDDT